MSLERDDDSFSAIEAGVNRAERHWRHGNFNAAVETYRDLLSQRLSSVNAGAASFMAADVVVVERLADLSMFFGMGDAAADLLSGMEALNAEAGNSYGADYTRLKRVRLALGRGRLREAYEILAAMRPSIGELTAIEFTASGLSSWEERCHWPGIGNADRAVLFSRLYLEMGRILAGLGQYANAIAVFQAGLHHAGTDAPDLARQSAAHLKLACVSAMIEKGELAAAREMLAAMRLDEEDLRHPGVTVQRLELYGKLDLLSGDFGASLSHFKEILDLCRQHHFEAAVLTASLNLAQVFIYVNKTYTAGELLRDARRQAERLNNLAAAKRAEFLLQLAGARGHSLADGLPITPSVTDMWRRSGATAASQLEGHDPSDLPQDDSFLTFFEDRSLAFNWHLGLRDWPSAASSLSRMQKVFGASDSSLIQTRLLVMAAMLEYYSGDAGKAERLWRECGDSLRRLSLTPELWQSLRFLGWCLAKLGRPNDERRAIAEDAQRLLDGMVASLPAEEQAVFLLNKWTADEEYIAGEINRITRLKEQAEAAPWHLRAYRRWRLLRELSRLMRHVDRYKGIVAQRAAGGDDRPKNVAGGVSLLGRLWSHPRDRVTLSFLVLPDRVLVTRVGWMTLDFGISPLTRLQVRNTVRRWHELISSALSGSRDLGVAPNKSEAAERETGFEPDARRLASSLAQALQIPKALDDLPRRVRALTVVADDSLNGFPFGAIVYRDKYLVEHYAISMAFESDVSLRHDEPRADRKALTVGVSRGSRSLPALRGVLPELARVSTWLESRRMKVRKLDDVGGAQSPVRKADVVDSLAAATVAHFACHGVFTPDSPDQSGMVLDAQSMDVLSLRELAALDLSRLSHITLSACWSADHFILPGRWIVGLPETLWRAGAHSILGSLWLVSDEVAVALMNRFYQNLDTMPRDEALRQAQLDCLHGRLGSTSASRLTSPIFWASYNLYGAYGRLAL